MPSSPYQRKKNGIQHVSTMNFNNQKGSIISKGTQWQRGKKIYRHFGTFIQYRVDGRLWMGGHHCRAFFNNWTAHKLNNRNSSESGSQPEPKRVRTMWLGLFEWRLCCGNVVIRWFLFLGSNIKKCAEGSRNLNCVYV